MSIQLCVIKAQTEFEGMIENLKRIWWLNLAKGWNFDGLGEEVFPGEEQHEPNIKGMHDCVSRSRGRVINLAEVVSMYWGTMGDKIAVTEFSISISMFLA